MARRQEQEPARPEITELPGGVLRMELPIRLPGLGHVNCYAIPDDRGAAIVDPGPARARAPGRCSRRGSRRPDLRPRDVHTVIVTHSHFDHFGGAARFAKETGAQIVAHRRFSFGPFPATRSPRSRSTTSRRTTGTRTAHPDEPEDDAARDAADRDRRRARDPRARAQQRAARRGAARVRGRRSCTRMRFRVAHWLGRSFLPVISRPGRARRRAHARRARVVRHAHARPHRRPHLPARPRVGRAALGRPRAAHDHASHRRASAARPIRSRRSSTASIASPRSRASRRCCPRTATRSTTCAARTRAIKRHHVRAARARARDLARASACPRRCRRSRSSCSTRAAGARWPRARPTRISSTCASPGEADRRDERDGTLRYVAG